PSVQHLRPSWCIRDRQNLLLSLPYPTGCISSPRRTNLLYHLGVRRSFPLRIVQVMQLPRVCFLKHPSSKLPDPHPIVLRLFPTCFLPGSLPEYLCCDRHLFPSHHMPPLHQIASDA